jgi:Fur family transcriptional regulator, zinc uptake regulator
LERQLGARTVVDTSSVTSERTPRARRRPRQDLSGIRGKILELLVATGQPVSAYWLIEELRSQGTSVVPPTVYRALNFLRRSGLAHRIESLNAFVACSHPGHDHQEQFLICTECGFAQELSDTAITDILHAKAIEHSFRPEQQIVEISGVCRHCATGKAAHDAE